MTVDVDFDRGPIPPRSGMMLCAWCCTWRDVADLVRIVRLATGVRRYVCRNRPCFRDGVRGADVDRVLETVPHA